MCVCVCSTSIAVQKFRSKVKHENMPRSGQVRCLQLQLQHRLMVFIAFTLLLALKSARGAKGAFDCDTVTPGMGMGTGKGVATESDG